MVDLLAQMDKRSDIYDKDNIKQISSESKEFEKETFIPYEVIFCQKYKVYGDHQIYPDGKPWQLGGSRKSITKKVVKKVVKKKFKLENGGEEI